MRKRDIQIHARTVCIHTRTHIETTTTPHTHSGYWLLVIFYFKCFNVPSHTERSIANDAMNKTNGGMRMRNGADTSISVGTVRLATKPNYDVRSESSIRCMSSCERIFYIEMRLCITCACLYWCVCLCTSRHLGFKRTLAPEHHKYGSHQ